MTLFDSCLGMDCDIVATERIMEHGKDKHKKNPNPWSKQTRWSPHLKPLFEWETKLFICYSLSCFSAGRSYAPSVRRSHIQKLGFGETVAGSKTAAVKLKPGSRPPFPAAGNEQGLWHVLWKKTNKSQEPLCTFSLELLTSTKSPNKRFSTFITHNSGNTHEDDYVLHLEVLIQRFVLDIILDAWRLGTL